MTVSVVICTHRRPQVLRRALQSVVRQTYTDLELVVVDDNGAGTETQKQTEAVVSDYPIAAYCVNSTNLGQAASLNIGINSAHGELISFLDDDDEFHPDKLAKQVARLRATGASGVYCNYEQEVGGKPYYVSRHTTGCDEDNLMRDMLLCTKQIYAGSTLLLRRAALEDVGGFDERFKRHVDTSFLISFFRRHKLALCEETLVTIHIGDSLWGVDPRLLFEAKCLLFSVFEQDIERLGEDAMREIYLVHWSCLYLHCLQKGLFRLALQSLISSVKNGRLDIPKLLRATASAARHAFE
jgi:glycosyltransferase involved in cell wall biosynthesis